MNKICNQSEFAQILEKDHQYGVQKFIEYAQTIGLIESADCRNNILRQQMKKSIEIKSRIDRLSDDEDKLEK